MCDENCRGLLEPQICLEINCPNLLRYNKQQSQQERTNLLKKAVTKFNNKFKEEIIKCVVIA
jgi:hypothetical protein